MCGIAGIVRHDGEQVSRDLLEGMCRSMIHRGPDEGGIYLDRYVGLGHRRLSIIDRAGGQQPMCNEDETIWITFNGEIYNFQELRDELITQGHRFKTRSDTEVILHLYEDLEEGCVQRLRGMFAFAIWDQKKNTLLLARDRLGIKPVYYFAHPRFLAFSSEMRPLLALEEAPRSLNLQALHDYLTFRYTIAPLTMIKAIRKLPPAHLLRVKDGQVAERQYWDLDFSKKVSMSEEDMVVEFERRLRSVTHSHLVGEVPLGILLSGGLDSTVIASLVSEVAGRRVKTFSVGFAGDEGSELHELSYARLAARAYETDHYELALTARQYADGLPEYVRHMEEPMADPSAVPLFYISRVAREHVTIVLSGEGGDETLAGYSFWQVFRGFRRAQWFRRIPRPIREGMLARINRTLLHSPRLSRYLKIAELAPSDYFQAVPVYMPRVFSEEAKFELYADHLAAAELVPSEAKVLEAYRRAAKFDLLDQMLYVYTKQWLPDDLLLKADKMTMANSLELRVPFLDHTLVEFAASLPANMKIRRNCDGTYASKYVLRRAVQARVPPEILNRPKVGFHVPVWKLFDEELRAMTWDLVHSRAFRNSGIFNMRTVTALFQRNRDGKVEEWWLLWPLLVLAMWFEQFCSTRASSADQP